jgi:molybdate transport system substrate-binding protein
MKICTALIAVIILIGSFSNCALQTTESLLVYSGAGTRKPMDEIGEIFQSKYGVKVNYNYAGSNALLSQMELTKRGDVYMPAETYYIQIAAKKGYIEYQKPVAYHIPVITVPKGNPANITKLDDLARPGARIAWGDPEIAAIGRLGNKILEKNGIKEAVWANVITRTPTMSELIIYTAMGQCDATVNWGDVVQYEPNIEIIEIPKEQNIIEVIPIGALVFSEYKDMVKTFIDFCSSDEGKAIFSKYGFPAYPDSNYG